MSISPAQAAQAIIDATPSACIAINDFMRATFSVRGGRVGSGMGTLLEGLWGYYVNAALTNAPGGPVPCEIAWLEGHEFNDFAVVGRDRAWDSSTRDGELLRVEAKSMNAGAYESKAHFDELLQNLGPSDLTVILVWGWEPVGTMRVCPAIIDHFVGFVRPIAVLRDELHLARGGRFVDRATCPDRVLTGSSCEAGLCEHHGEPLNAEGMRERLTGPATCRGSAKVSHAANFGGMVRMIQTRSPAARSTFRRLRRADGEADRYISFIHRNFPKEEVNQYMLAEWRKLADAVGVESRGLPAQELAMAVRAADPGYQALLRDLFD